MNKMKTSQEIEQRMDTLLCQPEVRKLRIAAREAMATYKDALAEQIKKLERAEDEIYTSGDPNAIRQFANELAQLKMDYENTKNAHNNLY